MKFKKLVKDILRPKPALSLVELLLALTVLALISTAGMQIFQSTQQSFVEGRTSLVKTKRNEAIAAFIYGDFINDTLPSSDEARLYINNAMPADLQAAEKLAVATVFGTASRFQFTTPKCGLSHDADPDIGWVRFPADCYSFAQTTIAERINQVLRLGVKVSFAIEGNNTRCTISQPLQNTGAGEIASAYVEDHQCLRMANDPQNVPVRGSHILLPRFVVYNSVEPASFYTSFVEHVGDNNIGITINLPNQLKIAADVESIISSINLHARDPNATIGVTLTLGDPLGILLIGSVIGHPIPPGVVLSNNNAASISLHGTIAGVQTALSTLAYYPPRGFFGEETLTITVQNGPIQRSKLAVLKIDAICGGETGTATRLDLGEYNSTTNQFTTRRYLTTMSVKTTQFPQTFYGFCKTGVRYDRADGLASQTTDDNGRPVKLCQDANQPDDPSHPHWPYVENSPAIPHAKPNSISVMLLEQTNNNTENRYSLAFMFDDANTPGGNKSAELKIENFEPGRDLTDITDVYTFADDDDEYQTGIIGVDGSIIAEPSWASAHDGFVVPLKLPAGAVDADGIFDLKFYDQRPVVSNKATPDPIVQILSTNTLRKWNFHAVIGDKEEHRVGYKDIDFDFGTEAPINAIKIVTHQSHRCKPIPRRPVEEPSSNAPTSGPSSPATPQSGEASSTEPPSGEPSSGEPSSGEPSSGEPPSSEPPSGEPPSGEPSSGEPSSGEPSSNEP